MLPYTAEVLFALFDECNQAIRPLQGVTLFLTAGVLMLTLRSRENRSRLIVAILAAGWVWTETVFHLVYFTKINFAAPAYGALFILQGALLFWTGVYRNRISIRLQRKPASYAGAVIFVLSALILPMIDWHQGLSWTEARFALLAPGTTAGLTLGLLMMADRRRADRAILADRPCARIAETDRRCRSVVAVFELCDFVETHQIVEFRERKQLCRALLGIPMLLKRPVDVIQRVTGGKKA